MTTNSSTPTNRMRFARWLLLSCTAVNLYLLGAACLLQFVGYPLLLEAGNSALPTLHAALTRRLGVVFIMPEFLALFFLLPLFRWRPANVRPFRLEACLALGFAYFVVTFGWHLPAHKRLALGHAGAMSILLGSHAVRTLFTALKCGLLLEMIAGSQKPQS